MPKDPVFGHLFLSAGAMKAGTTWLFSVLNRHPSLFFSNEKEIHYFHHKYVDKSVLSDERRLENARTRYLRIAPDRHNVARVRSNLHWVANYLNTPVDDFWYRNLFVLRRDEAYDCDFSNLYAMLPERAWRQIANDCEKLRVLYTLRDPVKRLWSHVKFHLQITDDIDRLAQWGPAEFEEFARRPFIWDNAEYGSWLRSMKAALAPEMFKVIFFEQMHADQRGTLARIEDFLDIPHFDFPQRLLDQRVNESVAHPMPEYFPGLFARDVERIVSEVEDEGFKVPDSWMRPARS